MIHGKSSANQKKKKEKKRALKKTKLVIKRSTVSH